MEITLIKNDDDNQITAFKLARIIFAETGGHSLRAAEALASMIYNLHKSTNRELSEIITDKEIFECLNKNSTRYSLLTSDINSRGMQMCVRIVQRLSKGRIQSDIMNTTRFHREDLSPDWAALLGYVAEIDGLLFYK